MTLVLSLFPGADLLGYGVPVPMARAVAAAIREAIECR